MPTVVVSRAEPFKFLLLAVTALLGVAYLTGSPPPPSIVATQPAWAVPVWEVALGLSGLVGLGASVWHGDVVRALRLEQAAMLINASAIGLYAGCVIGYSGIRGLGSGLTFLAWAGAAVWRAIEIRNDLRRIARAGVQS